MTFFPTQQQQAATNAQTQSTTCRKKNEDFNDKSRKQSDQVQQQQSQLTQLIHPQTQTQQIQPGLIFASEYIFQFMIPL